MIARHSDLMAQLVLLSLISKVEELNYWLPLLSKRQSAPTFIYTATSAVYLILRYTLPHSALHLKYLQISVTVIRIDEQLLVSPIFPGSHVNDVKNYQRAFS